jgi:hypothetical protein
MVSLKAALARSRSVQSRISRGIAYVKKLLVLLFSVINIGKKKMPKTRMEDIVVIIPGILGSVLKKDDEDIWASSRKVKWQALSNQNKLIEPLKLKARDDWQLDDLEDGIKATRLIEDTYLIPGLA